MKRIVFIFILMICTLLTACTKSDERSDKTITIASMGCFENNWSNGAFLKGVELAVKEAREAYEPLGYTINYTHYDDGDDYGVGMLIVDELISDQNLTAVLGSQNFQILEMAAHRFETAGKLMIAPHGIADYVLTDHQYQYTLGTTHSAYDVGAAAKEYAIDSGIKRWAVCYYDDAYNRREVQGFTSHKKLFGVEVMDYQKVPFPEKDFDYIYKRWDALGIEGVFIVPNGEEGFDLVRLIRERDEEIAIVGDWAFDTRDAIIANEEYLQGFVMTQAFAVDVEREKIQQFADRFLADGNERYDTWASHGYDSVRMVVDTAVKNGTTDPGTIAEALRRDGYEGLGCDYTFKETGELSPAYDSIIQFRDGTWEYITRKTWEK